MKIKSILWPSIALTLFFVVVTGILFPLAIWGISQAAMPHQANGSLIRNGDGQVIGSQLIGQSFSKPAYFHPRPSAAGSGYDAANSSGTNLGPSSDKLINGIEDGSFAGVKQLASAYREANGLALDAVVPVDAVTRSASGLDPHISITNARLQASRIAKARSLSGEEVNKLIDAHTDRRFIEVFGDPGVNVLQLNLALDARRK